MDLKTALEKLRRHGAAKAAGQVARPTAPPPSRQPVLDSSASLEARPFATPTRGPLSESGALPAMDGSAGQQARSREGVGLLRQLCALPPIATDAIGRPA